jgi:hypothetical protein
LSASILKIKFILKIDKKCIIHLNMEFKSEFSIKNRKLNDNFYILPPPVYKINDESEKWRGY